MQNSLYDDMLLHSDTLSLFRSSAL